MIFYICNIEGQKSILADSDNGTEIFQDVHRPGKYEQSCKHNKCWVSMQKRVFNMLKTALYLPSLKSSPESFNQSAKYESNNDDYL